MKIAYFGCDLFIQCLDIWRAHDHEIVTILAAGENNKHIGEYARNNNISYFTGKPDQQKIRQLEHAGVDCLFSIEYDCLIPLPSSRVMTINVHPTLLPHGRGPTPLSHLILHYPQYAGVTFHKLTERFDEGDIILQAPIQLDDEESLESLLVKLQYKIPQLLHELLADLPRQYQQAKAQTEGSYWPKLGDQDRLLDWHDSTQNISRMVRAFGRYGVVCCIGDEAWLVNHVETCATRLASPAGTLLADDDITCAVAVADGIVVIFKDSIIERQDLKI